MEEGFILSDFLKSKIAQDKHSFIKKEAPKENHVQEERPIPQN